MSKTPLTEEAAKATRIEEPTPQAASPHTVTSASVGTALTTGAGSITAFTLTQPTSTQVDDSTPLTLVDAAAAPTGPGPLPRAIFSANMRALASLYEPRPGVGLTPGMTAPTWPKNVLGPAAVSIPFTNGCFVQSCPANMTFTVTC
jgi:cytoskeletal protein RodZ